MSRGAASGSPIGPVERDSDSIPGQGRSPGEGNGKPAVVLTGKSHGQRSLEGYGSQGHKRIRHNLETNTRTHTHTPSSSPAEILKWLGSAVLMFGSSGLCLPICHSTSFESLVDIYESHHATLFPQLIRLRVANENSNRGQQTREMSEVGWLQNSESSQILSNRGQQTRERVKWAGFRILKVYRFSVV